VTKISVPDAKAWMKMGISWQCGPDDSVWLQNFTHTPFRFSYMDNKIVVVGYNTLAYMRSEPVSDSHIQFIYQPFLKCVITFVCVCDLITMQVDKLQHK
jgi:hypothetical protein